jgi:hypothetical protein
VTRATSCTTANVTSLTLATSGAQCHPFTFIRVLTARHPQMQTSHRHAIMRFVYKFRHYSHWLVLHHIIKSRARCSPVHAINAMCHAVRQPTAVQLQCNEWPGRLCSAGHSKSDSHCTAHQPKSKRKGDAGVPVTVIAATAAVLTAVQLQQPCKHLVLYNVELKSLSTSSMSSGAKVAHHPSDWSSSEGPNTRPSARPAAFIDPTGLQGDLRARSAYQVYIAQPQPTVCMLKLHKQQHNLAHNSTNTHLSKFCFCNT